MNNKGISVLISVLTIAVLLVASGVGYYFFSNPESFSEIKSGFGINSDFKNDNKSAIFDLTKEQVSKVIKQKLLSDGFNLNSVSDFKIVNVNGKYVRAEIVISEQVEDVFLVMIGDNWAVAEISSDSISCEKAEKMRFPASMVSDCFYFYPNAKKVSDILSQDEETLISAGEVEISGQIKINDDPSSNYFEILSEDGESVVIDINSGIEYFGDSFFDIDNGDDVLVNVSVTENKNDEIIFALEEIEKIDSLSDLEPVEIDEFEEGGSQDDYLDDGVQVETDNTNLVDGINIIKELDLSILVPQMVEDNESYDLDKTSSEYQNSLDRDFSGVDLQIISDF